MSQQAIGRVIFGAGLLAFLALTTPWGLLMPRAAAEDPAATQTAIFAGGCFWCTEADFDKVPGVVSTTSGYTGGAEPNPTYESVSTGATGHAEVVQVVYDPAKVTYAQLVDYYWRTVDPLTPDAQFCDRGRQYRTAIFALDDAQRQTAEASKAELQARFGGQVVTEIAPATAFTAAEAYHQDYARQNPLRYNFYRLNCGRDARLREVWGEEAGGAALLPKTD